MWNIELRRPLFNWEVNMWEEFLECIVRAALGTGDSDRLRWTGSQSGVYSPKGFWEMATTIGSREEDIWRLVWAKLAPPKVEAFLWKAIKGRLLVGTELLKCNIIVPWISPIIFCYSATLIEEFGLDFFNGGMLGWLCRVLLANFCVNAYIVSLELNCVRGGLLGAQRCFGPFGSLGTSLFFKGNEATWWANLRSCLFPSVREHIRLRVEWVPLVDGVLKFNVDGATREQLSLAECGGVLRNWDNHIMPFFSDPIGEVDSNEAELHAIFHALVLLAEIDWQGIRLVVIKSNSRVAVVWVLQSENRPWRYWRWFSMINEASVSLLDIYFHNIYKETDRVADVLAKSGVGQRS
ncbi:hypothetical protein GQ457_11G019820 [Hibiscus cannabinus]